MSEPERCPFCGEVPQVVSTTAMHACRVLDRELRVPLAAWNHRIIDIDALTDIADEIDDYAKCDDPRCGEVMSPLAQHEYARRMRAAMNRD